MKRLIINYHPSLLKRTIESLEIIPQKNLGIILSQDNMGFRKLIFYKEAYENLSSQTLTMIKLIFNEFENNFSFEEFRHKSCGPNSSKRLILDYLNAKYLMLFHRNEFKEMLVVSDFICDADFIISDQFISNCSKSVLLGYYPFNTYSKEVHIEDDKMAIIDLISKVFESEGRKEYDFIQFSSFNKNFKPYLYSKKK